jgi:hypothetical protein
VLKARIGKRIGRLHISARCGRDGEDYPRHYPGQAHLTDMTSFSSRWMRYFSLLENAPWFLD